MVSLVLIKGSVYVVIGSVGGGPRIGNRREKIDQTMNSAAR